MSYCLYLRKSRADIEAEAHGEMETLARHEKMLLELAKVRNYDITQIYREVVSGESIAARPVMQHLLQEVEQGLWQGVLVVEVERLARGDTIDQGIIAQTFKYSGTLIITPTKVYDPNNEFDEEYFEFGLFMSRREYKTINRRLQRGRAAAAKEGKHVASRAPYGYEKIKIPNDKGYTLRPLDDEAATVRYIFQLYTEGEQQDDGSYIRYGSHKIARLLNGLHIPAPQNYQYWESSTLVHILRSPVYIGKIRWNYHVSKKVMENGVVKRKNVYSPDDEIILADGLHPAIISEEIFQKAQEILNSNGALPLSSNHSLRNPFAGIIRCGKCGLTMISRPRSNGLPAIVCRNPNCDNISSRLDVVEARVLESLRDWVSGYELEWEDVPSELHESMDFKRSAISKARSELKTLDVQLAKTHDLLEQGIYTTEVFLARSKAISERIETAKKSISDLSASLLKDEKREASRSDIIPRAKYLLDVYESLPDAQSKNDLLREVIERIEYIKTSPGKKGMVDNFDIVIYPKIPPSVTP